MEKILYYKKVALHYKSGKVYIRNYYSAACSLSGNALEIDKIGRANWLELDKKFREWAEGDEKEFVTGLQYLTRITNEGEYTKEEISKVKFSNIPDYIEDVGVQ